MKAEFSILTLSQNELAVLKTQREVEEEGRERERQRQRERESKKGWEVRKGPGFSYLKNIYPGAPACSWLTSDDNT